MTFLTIWWQRRREKQQMTRLEALKWILEHGESWK
jgi:hypothetical protein